jgi:hypothetical protein
VKRGLFERDVWGCARGIGWVSEGCHDDFVSD